MVTRVACIEFKNIQERVNVQSRFFQELPSSSSSSGFATFYPATRKSPF